MKRRSTKSCGANIFGEMVERFKAHAWKACEVNSLRRFKSCSLRHGRNILWFWDFSNTTYCVFFLSQLKFWPIFGSNLGQNCIRVKKFRSIFTFSNGIYFLFGVARNSYIKQSVKDFGGNLVARDSQINTKKQWFYCFSCSSFWLLTGNFWLQNS